jgi:histone acetyltransferase (RNA polymerase elongator complex component)
MTLPVFLPHLGCRQRCIYCNQQLITGKQGKNDVEVTVRDALASLNDRTEVAIYGGNPLGLSLKELARLFSLFDAHRDSISHLRLSTEPIPPDAQIIELLKEKNVRIIELGIPAFNDETLRALGRHHTVQDLYDTYHLLTRNGFSVGLQVMIGLPNETAGDVRTTARHIADLSPPFIRIYPLVVLRDTALYTDFREQRFTPLSLEDAVERASFLYLSALSHATKVVKMGLTDNEFLKDALVAGPYHPAFGYLVRSYAFRMAVIGACQRAALSGKVTVSLSKRDVPHLIGYRRSNLSRLAERGIEASWEVVDLPQDLFQVSDGEMKVEGTLGEALGAMQAIGAINVMPMPPP